MRHLLKILLSYFIINPKPIPPVPKNINIECGGQILYIVNFNNTVTQQNLTKPNDLSTGIYIGTFKNLFPENAQISEIHFSRNGMHLCGVGYDKIYCVNLLTPWDLHI